NDEWPVAALISHGELIQVPQLGGDPLDAPTEPELGATVTVLDATHRYEAVRAAGGWELLDAAEHGAGVTPVVRFLDSHESLDRLPRGKVEPLLPLQQQLNQTTFGLLMAQQYAAFRQRWVTGMAIPEDEK